jgi:hypothetical protein
MKTEHPPERFQPKNGGPAKSKLIFSIFAANVKASILPAPGKDYAVTPSVIRERAG